jgi:hypothetical protein
MELGLIAKATDEATLPQRLDADEIAAFVLCREARHIRCQP